MTITFERAASFEELQRKSRMSVPLAGVEIALFAFGDEVSAFENRCPHQQLGALHQGEISNGCVTCPMHGWTFDLQSGRNTNGNGRLKKHPVRIVNGFIEVGFLDDAPSFTSF